MTRVVVAIAIATFAGGPSKLGPYELATSPTYAQQQTELGTPRALAPVTLLQLNDVYSTIPVNGAGGLARVATIKERLKNEGRTPFLVLAGDFLSSSVESTVFKGEQMIAALNAAGLDLATLGNHEFDFGEDILIQRMKEAKFQWVVSNVIDRRTRRPIGGAAPYVVRTFGNLKVGFIGLCLTTSEISRITLPHTQLQNPLLAAARYLPVLQRQGAQVIVALTHLAYPEDRRLVERFPQIDLVIGGHEHIPITATVGGSLISKAGSDAKFVARIDVMRHAPSSEPSPADTAPSRSRPGVERFFELIPVTAEIPDEPRTAEVVRSYEEKLSAELEVAVGESAVPLDAVAARIRAAEQPLGNLLADAIRAEVDADIAIMNSGSIRGDRIYPAGPISRRTILQMHPFGNVLCKIEAPGRVVLQALSVGLSQLPASAGQFPQVSGLSLSVDVGARPGNRVRDVKVGGQPLDPAKVYTVALPDYMLKGGDNYTMFKGLPVVVGPEAGPLLTNALEHYIAAARTVSPRVEGRITIAR